MDVTVLRNLQGILKNFDADQGLLVSWGGFNKVVLEEAGETLLRLGYEIHQHCYKQSHEIMIGFLMLYRRSCL
ncbi:hypothetical protein [Robertmurraya sp.]|uniref:hypothetical protein n=1 Tax=Robertmurraya sp. TaxID=2837525 RepID=UPI003703B8C7